jgi:hypothetical protein
MTCEKFTVPCSLLQCCGKGCLFNEMEKFMTEIKPLQQTISLDFKLLPPEVPVHLIPGAVPKDVLAIKTILCICTAADLQPFGECTCQANSNQPTLLS